MIVIVDSNEQATNPRVVARLRERFPGISVSKLRCGDINVITDSGKTVAIERKEAGDLLGSIGDGRVFKQVENMAKHADASAIIVVGDITYGPGDMVMVNGSPTNWHGKAVRAAITAIMWSACPVLRATNETLADVIMETVQSAEKPDRRLTRHDRIVTFPPLSEAAEILAGFPGVGPKRARAVLDYMGPTQDLADVIHYITAMNDMAEDSRPEGWGKVTVQNFRDALGLEPDEYLVVWKDPEHPSKKETHGKASSKKK